MSKHSAGACKAELAVSAAGACEAELALGGSRLDESLYSGCAKAAPLPPSHFKCEALDVEVLGCRGIGM